MDNPAIAPDLTERAWEGAPSVGQVRLDEAWRALQAEVPSVPARLESGELDTAIVVDVLCAAALRVLRNPEGHETESGRLDDYNESWKLADSSSDLYFTAAELRRVSPSDASLSGFSGSFKYA